MTVEPGLSSIRWLKGTIIALPAAIAVLLLSGGDVLVAYGKASQAATLPGNNVLSGGAILADMDEGEAARAAAMGALGSTPLSARALAYLATNSDARLRAIAGKVGWRDEWTQRRLYNASLAAGDADAALRHADALLRQQFAREELYAQFLRGVHVPGFRAALVTTVANSPHWPREFLVQHGSDLADAALLELVAARTKAKGGLDRQLAAPLLTRLVSLGRLESATAIWKLVPGHADSAVNILAWPDELAAITPTPFDWNLPTGYSVARSNGARLVAGSVLSGKFVRKLMALPPGDYRLVAAADGWLWGAGCADAAVVPSRRLTADSSFTVARDCPAVVLVLAPAHGGMVVLDTLGIEQVP